MTVAKQEMDAALARLVEAFPQTFVLERYQPHRPLKVGIAADIAARCPELKRPVLSAVLTGYANRVMYLKAMTAGTARIDLDGKAAGEVTARDAEYAAATLAKILASRQAGVVAMKAKIAAQVAKPAATVVPMAPAVAKLKGRPVLRLPAIRAH
jgi:ProP effector